MNGTRRTILAAVILSSGSVPGQANDQATERLADAQDQITDTKAFPATPILDKTLTDKDWQWADASLTWPDISDEHDIPLATISLGTKLKWAAAFWLPALAATDLPLHIYVSSVLEDDNLESAADGWPLFAVLEREEGYVARHFDTADALRTFKTALAERHPATAARIFVATPLPIPGYNEVDTLRADFSDRAAGSVPIREPGSDDGHTDAEHAAANDQPLDSFDEIYAHYPDIRTASKL